MNETDQKGKMRGAFKREKNVFKMKNIDYIRQKNKM